MMPLIDVVFLLLTFFVFAMVVMVRLDVSDIRLPVGASGDAPLERVPAITVTLSQEGELAVNGEPADRDTIVLTLNELREATPDARVFIAADDTSSTGDLFALKDRLKSAGISDLSFLRRPAESA